MRRGIPSFPLFFSHLSPRSPVPAIPVSTASQFSKSIELSIQEKIPAGPSRRAPTDAGRGTSTATLGRGPTTTAQQNRSADPIHRLKKPRTPGRNQSSILPYPLALELGFLDIGHVPPPTEEDIVNRAERASMDQAERRKFIRSYFSGIFLLVLGYLCLMIYRDLRESFRDKILTNLNHTMISDTQWRQPCRDDRCSTGRHRTDSLFLSTSQILDS
jgi:hypothetical protein